MNNLLVFVLIFALLGVALDSVALRCCTRLGVQGSRGGAEREGQKGAGGLACTPERADGEEQGQQQVRV